MSKNTPPAILSSLKTAEEALVNADEAIKAYSWKNKWKHIVLSNLEKRLRRLLDLSSGINNRTSSILDSKEAQLDFPRLETEDFRVVPDETWKKIKSGWLELLQNPEGDIIELTTWFKWKWQQYFSWDAAIRETAKAWKSIPTMEQLWQIFHTIVPNLIMDHNIQECWDIIDILELRCMGSYDTSKDSLDISNGNLSGVYWSSSLNFRWDPEWFFISSSRHIFPKYPYLRSAGLAVRCLVSK